MEMERLEAQVRELELVKLKHQLQQCVLPSRSYARAPSTPAEVAVPAMKKSAWKDNCEWETAALSTTMHCGLCIAAVAQSKNDSFKGFLLKDGTLGRSIGIRAGSHAFVCCREGFLRISLLTGEFGSACGHPALASEMPVLFAGEMEFDGENTLQRWNNVSGTYKCKDKMAFQTGLPIEKLWSVVEEGANGDPAECVENSGSQIFHTREGLVLRRALNASKMEFKAAKDCRLEAQQEAMSAHPKLHASYSKLEVMIAQRTQAIHKNGHKCVAV